MPDTLDVVILAEDPAAEVGSLFRWLRQDEDLRGTDVRRNTPPVEPGEMGAVTDFLQVILAPGGAAVAVATGVLTWLGTRNRRVRVRFRHGEHEVEVEAPRLKDVKAAAESVAEALDLHRSSSPEASQDRREV